MGSTRCTAALCALGVLALSCIGCSPGPHDRLAARGVAVTPGALVERAKAGDAEMVALLLAAGIDPDVADDVGVTALAWAVAGEDAASVRLLLAAGADPGVHAGNDGMTVLMLAAQRGALDLVKDLVEAGANVDTRDGFGNTALLQAAGAGHQDVAAFLLRQGADPDQATTGSGATPLGVAVTRGHTGVVAALLAADADTESRERSFGMTPLALAAFKGRLAIARMLVDAGADVRARDDDGQTPIAIAGAHGHTDVHAMLARADAARTGGATLFRPAALITVPRGWVLADPFTDQTPFFLGTTRLSRAHDPRGTSRALVRAPNAIAAQIFLIRGPAAAWGAALEREHAELTSHPLVRERDAPSITTHDERRVSVRLFRMEPGVVAGADMTYVLASVRVGEERLVVDAGGPTETFSPDTVVRFVETLDLHDDLGMRDKKVVAEARPTASSR